MPPEYTDATDIIAIARQQDQGKVHQTRLTNPRAPGNTHLDTALLAMRAVAQPNTTLDIDLARNASPEATRLKRAIARALEARRFR